MYYASLELPVTLFDFPAVWQPVSTALSDNSRVNQISYKHEYPGQAVNAALAPGGPVDGAVMRVDRWPPPPAGETAGAPDWPEKLGRRDARYFARSVRLYGLVEKLPQLCEDVGGALATASDAAR